MPRHSTAVAAIITSPHHTTAAATALVVSCRDATARRVSEHVGLPLAISRHHLAINSAAAVHATLPHRLHAHVLALALVHVSPW